MKRSRWLTTLRLTLAGAAVIGVALFGASIVDRDNASANQPNAGLEFTLHVDGCSTVADYKGSCAVTQGSTFVASVSLDAIPYPYDSLAVTVAYTGVTSKDNPNIVWPDCAGEATAFAPGFVNGGCVVLFAPSSTFTGTVFTASFNCAADGQLSLTHDPANTLIIDYGGKTSTETGPDVLNIDCAPATATFTPGPTATPTPPAVAGVGYELGGTDRTSSESTIEIALALLAVAVLGVASWRVVCRKLAG